MSIYIIYIIYIQCTPGTAADVCELLAGDEIIQINGAEVAKHYKESVELVIDNAVKVGLVDLKVRRYLTQG